MQVKKRFKLSMEKASAGTWVKPYRIAVPRTSCGFVFIPIIKELLKHRQQGLKNLTFACKYDLKLPKCIGMSFTSEGGGHYFVEWCYIDGPWEPQPELDKMLEQNNPFREVNVHQIARYLFRNLESA